MLHSDRRDGRAKKVRSSSRRSKGDQIVAILAVCETPFSRYDIMRLTNMPYSRIKALTIELEAKGLVVIFGEKRPLIATTEKGMKAVVAARSLFELIQS